MSKSLGNVVAPQQVSDDLGADILRLWIVSSDYAEDMRVGPDILKQHVESYRRIRNTLRYLLGAVDGFSEAERIDVASMPDLERWVLHRLSELDGTVQTAIENYDFHRLFRAVHDFCAVDLSAFYFDVRKDALYCDRPDAPRRRAARTVMSYLFDTLTKWLAPILVFTTEEAWEASGQAGSVHLQQFPKIPAAWQADELAQRWGRLRELRSVVTGALEIERAAKRIGSSLQAKPVVYLADAADFALAGGIDFDELCIVSELDLRHGAAPEGAFALADVAGAAVRPALAEGEKCERCRRVLPEVGRHTVHPDLCERCVDAVDSMRKDAV
jgi:isoleucyl-tRNA synthetase